MRKTMFFLIKSVLIVFILVALHMGLLFSHMYWEDTIGTDNRFSRVFQDNGKFFGSLVDELLSLQQKNPEKELCFYVYGGKYSIGSGAIEYSHENILVEMKENLRQKIISASKILEVDKDHYMNIIIVNSNEVNFGFDGKPTAIIYSINGEKPEFSPKNKPVRKKLAMNWYYFRQ
jgi:hypothetical protein